MPALEEGLDELIRHGFPKTLADGQEVKVGFVGEFGPHRSVSCPGNLQAGSLWGSCCFREPRSQDGLWATVEATHRAQDDSVGIVL